MKKILFPCLIILLLSSCITTPTPGSIDLTAIKYVQSGAENLPDDEASYLCIGAIFPHEMNLALIDNVLLSDVILGSREVSSSTYAFIERNGIIKMVPGEYKLQIYMFPSGAGQYYRVSYSMNVILEKGMAYYYIAKEDSGISIRYNSRLPLLLHKWTLGQQDLKTEAIEIDLEEKAHSDI